MENLVAIASLIISKWGSWLELQGQFSYRAGSGVRSKVGKSVIHSIVTKISFKFNQNIHYGESGFH